jgi:site-specific DNA-methyltransferase (adenine-specific)
MPQKTKFRLNSINQGNGLQLLKSLPENRAKLIFFDPQYEKVKKVLKRNYPLKFQMDQEISQFLKEIERILKPSAFCLLWVNKTILNTGRMLKWLIKIPLLKIVDLLVWYKQNTLGMSSWLRSQAEFVFLLQKQPTNHKLFKNRSFGNVWVEDQLTISKRKHPHQKPKGLIKAIIEATTEPGDLVVDPCAGSFMVLEVCQETGREFMGCDLTYQATQEFMKKSKPIEPVFNKFCLNCFEFV